MKYLFAYFLLLLPILRACMEPMRENKLILSMVQNNTRSFYRISSLHVKELKNKKISLLQKMLNARIEPFFLAERLAQALPSKEIALEGYYVLKNCIMNDGCIKIENVMKPQDFIFLFVKQQCTFENQKLFSLNIALCDSQLKRIRMIERCENCFLKSDKLHSYLNIVFNSDNLHEIEITATPQN